MDYAWTKVSHPRRGLWTTPFRGSTLVATLATLSNFRVWTVSLDGAPSSPTKKAIHGFWFLSPLAHAPTRVYSGNGMGYSAYSGLGDMRGFKRTAGADGHSLPWHEDALRTLFSARWSLRGCRRLRDVYGALRSSSAASVRTLLDEPEGKRIVNHG